VPLYEYQCKKCKHKFEKIQKFSDPPVKKCPECGSPVEKLLHAPAVQFKGTGWYVTDYAGKKGAPPDGAEKKSDSAGGEKKEDKPAAREKEKDSKAKKSEAKKNKE
jgi:putative FmdB family regulatory protein